MKGTCHHVHGSPMPSSETRSLAVLSSTQRRRLLVAAKASRSSKLATSRPYCASATAFRRSAADQRRAEDSEGPFSCLRLPSRPIPSDGDHAEDDTGYGGITLIDGYNVCESDPVRVGHEGLLEHQGFQRTRLMQRGGRWSSCCSSRMQDATRPMSEGALMTVRERVEHDARQRRLERHAAKRRQEDQTSGHTAPPARRRKRKAKDLRRQVLLKNAQQQRDIVLCTKTALR